MSTRSLIGIALDDVTVRCVYCHWDGYLAHNGRVLLQHYADRAKVEALIALGDLSSLQAGLGEKHDFNWLHTVVGENTRTDPRAEMTTAYGRDRGDQNVGPHIISTAEFYAGANFVGIEYSYLYGLDGAWTVAQSARRAPEPLATAKDDSFGEGE